MKHLLRPAGVLLVALCVFAGSSRGNEPMPKATLKTPLPRPFVDQRVEAALADPVPEDVILAVDLVPRGKIPFDNFRWRLKKDGKLYFVRHSKKPGDWQVPCDRPLPKRPALTLDAKHLSSLEAALGEAAFFSHPGYEHPERVHDGEY